MLLNRRTLKAFLTLAKQTLNLKPRDSGPVVTFSELGDAFTISATHDGAWLEYREVGEFDFTLCSLPWLALSELVDSGADDLTLTMEREQNCVSWTENGTPVEQCYPDGPSKECPTFPAVDRWTAHGERLFPALWEACQTADVNSTRYALGCLCLRGGKQDLVATDSRQLLIQHGFDWPWDEEVLIPTSRCFRSATLRKGAESGPVEVGKTDEQVVFRFGSWRVALPIETEARYPDIDAIVPAHSDIKTTLTIDDTDRRWLADRLPRSSQQKKQIAAVELNGAVAIRCAEREKSPTQEWILSNSTRQGPESHFQTDVTYLARLPDLGLSRIDICDHLLFVARDSSQTYLWRGLSGDPSPRPEEIERVASPRRRGEAVSALSTSNRKQNVMPKPASQSKTSAESASEIDTVEQLIERATTIKSNLKDLQSEVQDLITALRGQKKQAKIVRNTIDSLQKLNTLQA
ncbi:MAG: hypothetical protein HUJ26_15895 [Planctomycetaceae bacterium]|nr:hypothetical protein [Planctomycetaceae bacterium]